MAWRDWSTISMTFSSHGFLHKTNKFWQLTVTPFCLIIHLVIKWWLFFILFLNNSQHHILPPNSILFIDDFSPVFFVSSFFWCHQFFFFYQTPNCLPSSVFAEWKQMTEKKKKNQKIEKKKIESEFSLSPKRNCS